MAYNKSKYVEAAQKLLNQGKVAQAIAEYQQILKYEPRDQVTLMTIGELYIRQGETFQAIEYFERLAQLFVSDGFLTKAIAVYKRISKLAPEEVRPLEKLADLYVQQGVMSEARPLFLQLAELHLKNGKQPEAIALLKKLLLAEPDNLRIQIRLADLYVAMGQSGEALEGYVSAAQRALARGDQAECERLADRALQINAKSLDALIVKARSYSLAGNTTKAVEILERVPDLDKGGEPAELLLDIYLKASKWDEASALALRIFSHDEKNFTATQKVTEGFLESGQGERAMSLLSRIRIPMIDAGEHEGVAHLLQSLATRLPGRLEPLEWLVDTFGRTSDSFRLPDALANLGDALLASGKTERAKEVLQQLVDRDPENDSAKRKLNDVLRKMGALPAEPKPAAEPVAFEDNLQAELPQPPAAKIRGGLHDDTPSVDAQAAGSPKSPLAEQELDEETQKFIAQSLTDVDLFASYGLTQKAIGLLEAILRRAPMHTPTLEKLLDFVLGAGDDRRTAELAAQLEHIHAGRGDTRSSERFGELRRRFQRAAGLSDDEIAAAVAAAMPQPVDVQPVEATKKAPMEEVPAAPANATPLEIEAVPLEAAIVTPAPTPQVSAELPGIEITKPPEVAASPQAAAESAAEEVDLSAEWASLLEETKEPSAPLEEISADERVPAAAASEEADLASSFLEQAMSMKKSTPAHPVKPSGELPEFEVPADSPVAEEADTPSAEIPAEMTAAEQRAALAEQVFKQREELLPDEELTALRSPEHAEVAAEGREPALDLPQNTVPGKTAPEPDLDLDQDFELVLEAEPVVPAHEMLSNIPIPPTQRAEPHKAPAGVPVNAQSLTTDDFLTDLAKEMDELGLGELTRPVGHLPEEKSAPSGRAAGGNQSRTAAGGESGPLKEVFDEFRAELGEMGAEDEDLETHYNLGIAFREMGLLEEAIGEFQKVAQATDRGKAFRYTMQCCTLLGLAFMEKGQPAIAAIWYERALLTPGMDTESKLALRYDLGVAQESAGELDAALKSFSQVYAINIDYRDVAERIHSLQKPAR
ncbi:MAG TPA: tetratricopeptide repeat protein [Candidatus Acidoferrum sp.]|jgi:tetratricopeptide (TPR) repeat protein|nr:tetratricopeptide repeat protein [Candidatus Acidoferrum sp.]